MALTARLARASALHLDTPPTDVTAKTTDGEVPQRDTLMRSVTPLAVLILAFAATATGCGDAFSPEGVAGVYRLVSISEHTLPYSLIVESDCGRTGRVSPGTFTYQNGSLTLSKQETFVVERNWTYAGECNDSGTYTSSGSYSLTEPSTIRLSEAGSTNTWEGTVSGNRVTVFTPHRLVFER
jgi:hypothetical protein